MVDPFHEPYKDPYVEERDGAAMRWLKFISLIIALAGVGGIICGGYTFWMIFQSHGPGVQGRIKKEVAQAAARGDSFERFKTRVVLGTAAGALFGLVYVVRCVIKKQDP